MALSVELLDENLVAVQYLRLQVNFYPLPFNFMLLLSPNNETEKIKISRVPYASNVGSLMFVMSYTRLDISQAVGRVSRFI